ncbi:acyl-CoA dehydrogenase family protein [Bartonella sp. LJL80]
MVVKSELKSVDDVRLYVQNILSNYPSDMDVQIENNNIIPEHIIHDMGHAGLYGISIPTTYGGLGCNHLSRFIAIEEASYFSGALGGALQSAILGTAMVQQCGSEQQKKKWLPRFASGEDIISICITEQGSGSHILGMETTGTKANENLILNGKKCWIANSHIATVHGVIFRTAPPSKGLTAVLVENTCLGVRPGVANDNTGLRGFNIGELIFDNCIVAINNMIGRNGDGIAIAHQAITTYGKPNLTAVALGVHRRILHETIYYAKNRTIYNRPMTALESVRLKIGEIYTNYRTAKLHAYNAMQKLDSDGHADSEIMLAKLIGTELAFKSAKYAMDVFGARGTSRNAKIERLLRDSLMLFPPAATSDIHRKRLAEIALGEYVPTAKIPTFEELEA